jgi:BirA family transcriptional regulator, biotin operon repressor / biotin---[acetyl-CoA-carboxylase] ligase
MTAESAPLFIGSHVIRLPEVDSTNTFAMGLVRGTSMVAEGVVVSAYRQSQGRGQRGNAWYSEAGKNITCSIILRPGFLNAAHQFDLTRAVALGISDLLGNLLKEHEVRIKWPNDIVVIRTTEGQSSKKLCGILIENMLNGNQLGISVVGIGLNINQTDFGEDAPRASSVKDLTATEQNLDEVMKRMFGAVEKRYLQLRAGHAPQLRSEYLSRLFRKDEPGRYTDFKTIFDGIITDVAEDGRLVMNCDGKKREFGFKEIGFLG